MFEGIYKIADIVIKIISIHEEVHKMCCGYESASEENFLISTTQTDIEFERKISVEYNNSPEKYSDAYLETLAVYRKFAEYISYKNYSLFHGALIELDGDGYLFTANSGTGKTTHILNWLKMYPSTIIINGDKPILKVSENTIMGYGTPWCGKEGYQKNASVPLKAIIILERDEANSISRIPTNEALPILLDQCHHPNDSMGIKRALDMCVSLTESVNLYRLKCNMLVDSARVAYEGINNSL